MPFSPSSFGGIPSITEQMSESPTHSPTSQPSDEQITPGGLAVQDNIPTLGKMQAGSLVAKLVVLIEGVEYVLSDCNSTAAIQLAMKGTDWASATVLPGLFVDLHNSQSITPDDPFANNGRCTIRVVDTDGTDVFGILVNKRSAGDETTLTAKVDRDDTTLNVASTANFASSGTVYIGTERISYTGKTAASFTGCTRGMYSPFGTAESGSGGSRFANHHRIAVDSNHVQLNPVVSEQPRVWIGKRVGVWLHTWNEATSALNTHANAQLVFAGRIVGISDDPDTFHTVLELDHETAVFKDAVIGKDIWSGEIAPGIHLQTGRTFSFRDWKYGSATKFANDLTVVAGAPASANEIQTGIYTATQICDALSAWLASELTAARAYGIYNWASPVTSNVGLRTKSYWRIEHASDVGVEWHITMPGEVAAFLGMTGQDPGEIGQTCEISVSGKSNESRIKQGESVPFESLVFRPSAPGRLGQEFATDSMVYDIENERGQWVDQWSLLPAAIKESCPSTVEWGLFMLDDRVLMVGSYASNQLINCWISPYQLASDNSADSLGYIGRRADEPSAPVTVRQVYVFENTFENLINTLVYSTGTIGYNHADHDSLGYGLGLGLCGEMLGDEWERSLSNLPGADAPLVVVIDEPTKFSELFRSDLGLRRAFVRWTDRHFELSRWRTPLVANASVTFSESNKAAPSGQQENHRIASQETDEWCHPVVKVDYARDFGSSRGSTYLKSVQLEDQTAVDDAGGTGRSVTLKMRNTFAQFESTGSGIEALLPEYISTMPMFSRAARRVVRSIDMRYFEGVSVGDVALVTDSFARDPLTGQRGINARAALVTRHSYGLGGPDPQGGAPKPMGGEVELFFLDTQRGGQYAPSAAVDYEATFGGFDKGYNSTTSTIRCRPHDYSHVMTVVKRGLPVSVAEGLDASWFEAGDKIRIIQRDPADPASTTTWDRTISSVSGNDIVLTSGLSSPAWDNTKKYRITYQPYTSCQATQLDFAFQADDADEQIQDAEPPYHFSAEDESFDYNAFGVSDAAELVATNTYGDGVAMDVGTDRTLGATINNFIDRKSAHQAPCLWSEYTESTNTYTEYTPVYMGPIYLGNDSLTATVTRSLTVAVWMRSSAGAAGYIRATLSRIPPVLASGESQGMNVPVGFTDHFSQAEWSSSSTTWGVSSDATLSVAVKDLFFGYAWLTIEKKGEGQSRGLAKCIEGPRVVRAGGV